MTTEREFIRGNRDGPKRTNDSYTVCRLRVSQERLDEELSLGLHGHFVSASRCWECPAHIFLAAEHKAAARGVKAPKRLSAPSVTALRQWLASDQGSTPAETLEVIQRDPDRTANGPTYTICRVAVPRARLAREVAAGLHPRYHVRDGSRGPFVQGNPTEPFDNVNYPDTTEPGLGPRQLCPLRLLRPPAVLPGGP